MENIFLSVWVMLIGEYNQVAFALVALPPYFDHQYDTRYHKAVHIFPANCYANSFLSQIILDLKLC